MREKDDTHPPESVDMKRRSALRRMAHGAMGAAVTVGAALVTGCYYEDYYSYHSYSSYSRYLMYYSYWNYMAPR
jgi:hypothetical protein